MSLTFSLTFIIALTSVVLSFSQQSEWQLLYDIFLIQLYIALSGYKYGFVDQNIGDMNITEVAEEWAENRNVVRKIYNSSLEGVLQAIRKAE